MRLAVVSATILCLAVAAAACGRATPTDPPPSSSGSSAAEPSAPRARSVDWQDPEPPGAQALAEEVVGADWNRDKTTALEPRTTTLAMRITTLVDRTTGIAGFRSELAAADTSIDDRLSRLGARQTATEVTIRLPGSVLFDFDSADLRPDAESALADVAAVLAAYGSRPATIGGHTDSIASEEYNQKLSERRAQSVRDWLVAHGVAAGRLKTAGHGEAQPVADNATAAGRQQNRRVEIVIAKQD